MDEQKKLIEYWDFENGLTYLNHGSFGACPKRILERQYSLQRGERQPRFLGAKTQAHLKARGVCLPLLGALPSRFVNNATEAVNTVLRSCSFEPDDELL